MSIRDMVDSIVADDEEEEPADAGSDDSLGSGNGLMGDDGGDGDGGHDLGELGGLDDGGDDLGGLDDGFGEMEGGDDGMAGGGNIDELEHRLDELENEVSSLSSTVNTVRNENEQISNSVEEVEENVRKLLDIYEMITRGVNPFPDEMDGTGMGGGLDAQDGSFGLSTDDEQGDQDETVDEDITDADAEGLLDDDLVDDEPDRDDEMGMEADAGDTLEDGSDDSDEQTAVESEPATEQTVEAADPTTEATVETTEQTVKTQSRQKQNTGTADTTSGKPYIASVPEGFAADLIVVEWLEFLVEEAGIRETARALTYYESVNWISEEVADELETYLNGFEDTRRGTLMIDHHEQSLKCINQLNGGTVSGLNGVTGIWR